MDNKSFLIGIVVEVRVLSRHDRCNFRVTHNIEQEFISVIEIVPQIYLGSSYF